MKAELGLSLPLAKTRCSGFFSVVPAATRITAPSPISAVLSATAMSSVSMVLPTCLVTRRSPLASASASEPMLNPGSGARSDKFRRKGTIDKDQPAAPRRRTIACRRLSRALSPPHPAATASGSASRISARKSVYFHSSTRRCGSPRASNCLKAFSRNAATAPLPGSVAARRLIGVGERLLGRGLDGADFDVHRITPPRRQIARSRSFPAPAPVPCRPTSPRGPWPARARRRARCN